MGKSMYGNNTHDWFGWLVDISPIGDTLTVGTSTSDGPGYVKNFSLEGDDNLSTANWKQIGRNIERRGNGNLLGHSVSLSKDVQTLAVGASLANGKDGDDDVVRMSVYQRDDSKSRWTQIGEGIEGEAARDNSRWSLSLSGDGDKAAIGYPDGEYDLSSHVRAFVLECHIDEVC
jgi:hypothetical protein